MSAPATPKPLLLGNGAHALSWGARTSVMGVINCTPDSFTGDGVGTDVIAALKRAAAMVADGVDLLDVGAESTRPGATPVSAEEELARVVPVVERIARELAVPVSVDTTKSTVARAALTAGAVLVNDIHGLRGDIGVATAIAQADAAAIAMHNQRDRPHHDVIDDIRAGFEASLSVAESAGIARERLILDPGFGFGWNAEQNLEMLRRLAELRSLGLPLLVGTSRKSTIGQVLDLPVEERLEGTAATVAIAIMNGADIVRVHDVRAMVRVARMTDAVVRGGTPPTGTEA